MEEEIPKTTTRYNKEFHSQFPKTKYNLYIDEFKKEELTAQIFRYYQYDKIKDPKLSRMFPNFRN